MTEREKIRGAGWRVGQFVEVTREQDAAYGWRGKIVERRAYPHGYMVGVEFPNGWLRFYNPEHLSV